MAAATLGLLATGKHPTRAGARQTTEDGDVEPVRAIRRP